jgi:hypothetical protein
MYHYEGRISKFFGLCFMCSFSHSGGVLCGVGKNRHGKSQVVVWNTSGVTHSGEVCVLARAHTDVSIERMRVAGFDDSRYLNKSPCRKDPLFISILKNV